MSETKEKKVVEKNDSVKKEEVRVIKVGDIITQTRKNKNMKIDDISSVLCIRKVYLLAIEESKYSDMPEFPYGLGFVKSYADYLGLDGEALYEAYKKEINYISKNDPSRMDFEVIGTTSYSPNYTYVIVSLIAVVVIYMLWFAYSTYMTPSSSSSSRDTYKSPVKEQILEDIKFDNKEIIMDAQEADNGYEEFDAITGFEDVTKEEAKAEEEVQIAEVEKLKPQISGRGVEIAVKDVTWFEVKNENRLFVSKEFKAGDVYKVPNLRGLLISAGRVENIEVYIDGNLTKVFTPYRKTNISLDEVLENTNH